jgi:FMN-dependent NADH-azoreductase
MTQILQLNTSLAGDGSQSSRLAREFVDVLKAQRAGARVTVRDLAREPVPHLDGERFGAFIAAPAARTPEQRAVVDYSDALIAELQRAELIVLGLPMYNFGVPSQLKSYFDHVARAGITFRYTANGPEGLLKGKKAYVFATRGGLYAGTPLDTQTHYVRDFLRFLGIDDVEFVYAEGLAIGEDQRRDALAAAAAQLERLAA